MESLDVWMLVTCRTGLRADFQETLYDLRIKWTLAGEDGFCLAMDPWWYLEHSACKPSHAHAAGLAGKEKRVRIRVWSIRTDYTVAYGDRARWGPEPGGVVKVICK